MEAPFIFDNLIQQIVASNLNFRLERSPFSAVIQLKRSLIKDSDGNEIKPRPQTTEAEMRTIEVENGALLAKLAMSKKEVDDLRIDLGQMKADRDTSDRKKSELEAKIKQCYKVTETKSDEINLLKKSIKSLSDESAIVKCDLGACRKALKEKDKEISRLESKQNNLDNSNKKLKDDLKDLKKEKTNLEKESRKLKTSAANSSAKKSLSVSTNTPTISQDSSTIFLPPIVTSLPSIGSSNKTTSEPSSITLIASKDSSSTSVQGSFVSKSLPNSSEATTSILTKASPPPPLMKNHPWNNTPLFLAAHEPAQCWSTCRHQTQCTIRQPRTPPFPSITFLINEKSNYHLHMMAKSADEFAGCFRCFFIEHENYGCDDCTWLKWWLKWHGELHGFPDVSPWSYKQYL